MTGRIGEDLELFHGCRELGHSFILRSAGVSSDGDQLVAMSLYWPPFGSVPMPEVHEVQTLGAFSDVCT